MPPRARKPAPEPLLPVLTIDDRCVECGWTLFPTFSGKILCINGKCPEHHKDIAQEVHDAD